MKAALATFLVPFMLCAADESKLVAQWSFENSAGEVVRDSVNFNDGVVKGTGKLIFEKGPTGNAAVFDNGKNFIRVADSPALALTDDFTISCFIKPSKVDGYNTILWKGDRLAKPEKINYYLDIKDGIVELKGKDAAGEWIMCVTKSPVIVAGKWQHIEVVFSKGKVDISVNGEVQKTSFSGKNKTFDGNSFIANNSELIIGNGAIIASNTGYPFCGAIDEVKIYNNSFIDIK